MCSPERRRADQPDDLETLQDLLRHSSIVVTADT
jgi:hypothetical protein